jgi:hypothetical protein
VAVAETRIAADGSEGCMPPGFAVTVVLTLTIGIFLTIS